MTTMAREIHILKKEKTDILKKEFESVINRFESENEGWVVLTAIVGRDFECHFAVDMNVVNIEPNE